MGLKADRSRAALEEGPVVETWEGSDTFDVCAVSRGGGNKPGSDTMAGGGGGLRAEGFGGRGGGGVESGCCSSAGEYGGGRSPSNMVRRWGY